MKDITQDRLKELLEYRDGKLYWREDREYYPCKGKEAGHIADKGYRKIRVDRRTYRTHRLVWLYHYGVWPTILDHIDQDKLNNRVENLREATNQQNIWNSYRHLSRMKKRKTSFLGVIYSKYKASISVDGRMLRLGSFDCEIEAAQAYNIAVWLHRGEFGVYNGGGGEIW